MKEVALIVFGILLACFAEHQVPKFLDLQNGLRPQQIQTQNPKSKDCGDICIDSLPPPEQ